jgi:hypothetical protein
MARVRVFLIKVYPVPSLARLIGLCRGGCAPPFSGNHHRISNLASGSFQDKSSCFIDSLVAFLNLLAIHSAKIAALQVMHSCRFLLGGVAISLGS